MYKSSPLLHDAQAHIFYKRKNSSVAHVAWSWSITGITVETIVINHPDHKARASKQLLEVPLYIDWVGNVLLTLILSAKENS